jgi:hypothetical protein
LAQRKTEPVMDIHPWPNGLGFEGRDAWWESIGRLEEQQKLDQLVGTALLSEEVCQQLLHHDEDLLLKFHLSEPTRRWLMSIQADSLTEFAEALLSTMDISA